MKDFNKIYEDLNSKFEEKSNLKIQDGTVLDFYSLATSDVIEEAHKQIEDNKNPHLYTGLKGKELDELGIFLNIPREANEEDDSYLFRMMNWKDSSEASNYTAIEVALMNMDYASHVNYIPLTQGCGTATAYIIPKSYDGDMPDKAIYETINRLEKVTSPSTFITYTIPDPRPVNLVFHISSTDGDIELIKSNIEAKVKEYTNNLAPGEYFDIGLINKIGVNEPNVDFFRVSQVYISQETISDLKVLQVIDSKFIYDDIVWWEVNQ